MNNLDQLLSKLKEELENDNLDNNNFKSVIYAVLKQCLLERKYQITVGNYYFDFTPNNLSAIYDGFETRVEVTNNDLFESSKRNIETRFFVESEEEKNFYDVKSPYFVTIGEVLNINGSCFEQYSIEANNLREGTKINDYVKAPEGYEFGELDEYNDDGKALIIMREIKKEDSRTDVYNFFNKDKIKPVIQNYDGEFIKGENVNSETDYSKLLPDLSERKKRLRYIYNTIIELYDEFMKKVS